MQTNKKRNKKEIKLCKHILVVSLNQIDYAACYTMMKQYLKSHRGEFIEYNVDNDTYFFEALYSLYTNGTTLITNDGCVRRYFIHCEECSREYIIQTRQSFLIIMTKLKSHIHITPSPEESRKHFCMYKYYVRSKEEETKCSKFFKRFYIENVEKFYFRFNKLLFFI